jgi:hypothetical protein
VTELNLSNTANGQGGDLYRLEYLTRVGWVVGHGGLRFVDPQAYVDGLAGKKIVARCVGLDQNLQPTKEVYVAANPPPAHDSPGGAPVTRVTECAACGEPHDRPWGCLL